MPWQPSSDRRRRVLRYEAQPTRMFGSYSVTAHYDDGSIEALAYGEPHYCVAEAARRNREIDVANAPAGDGARTSSDG